MQSPSTRLSHAKPLSESEPALIELKNQATRESVEPKKVSDANNDKERKLERTHEVKFESTQAGHERGLEMDNVLRNDENCECCQF